MEYPQRKGATVYFPWTQKIHPGSKGQRLAVPARCPCCFGAANHATAALTPAKILVGLLVSDQHRSSGPVAAEGNQRIMTTHPDQVTASGRRELPRLLAVDPSRPEAEK